MNSRIKSQRYRNNPCRISSVSEVRQGLSYTPSDMLNAQSHGIPITNQLFNDSLFYDGDVSNDMTLSVDLTRGVDINDVWNAQQDSRSKLLRSHLKSSQDGI